MSTRRSSAVVAVLVCAASALVAVRAAPVAAARARTGDHHVPGACPPNLADELASTGGARELVLVVAPDHASTHASLSVFRRDGACYSRVAGPFAARVGADGLSGDHREGVPTTPIGSFTIAPVMFGTEPNPGVAYRYHRIACGDWWDEDPASASYNRFVHLACGAAPPFDNGEALWLAGSAYDYLAVIDYNTAPVVPGRGSGIFLHLDNGSATLGCVSVGRSGLLTTLRLLRPGDRPRIVIGTASGIRLL